MSHSSRRCRRRRRLVGKTLGVEDIAGSGADVLLRVALEDGRSFRRVLTADQPGFRVPAAESRLEADLTVRREHHRRPDLERVTQGRRQVDCVEGSERLAGEGLSCGKLGKGRPVGDS